MFESQFTCQTRDPPSKLPRLKLLRRLCGVISKRCAMTSSIRDSSFERSKLSAVWATHLLDKESVKEYPDVFRTYLIDHCQCIHLAF